MFAKDQILDVEVQSVEVYGIFCRHESSKILVVIPETSWIASFCSCRQFAEPGDRFAVQVVHVDRESGAVAASIKRQYPDPWATDLLQPDKEYRARVVRHVAKADRCGDQSGYLIEVLPGAFAMLCADGILLEANEFVAVSIRESDVRNRSVTVALVHRADSS